MISCPAKGTGGVRVLLVYFKQSNPFVYEGVQVYLLLVLYPNVQLQPPPLGGRAVLYCDSKTKKMGNQMIV